MTRSRSNCPDNNPYGTVVLRSDHRLDLSTPPTPDRLADDQ
jgi:hypothetical protein